MKSRLLLLALTLFLQNALKAQGTGTPGVDHSYKPLVLKLDEQGQKFLRLITWHQVWISHTRNNPRTLDVNGEEQKAATDIAIRRSRFIVQAQVSPRFMIVTHWGINNQSFINGGGSGILGTGSSAQAQGGKRPQMYLHDAYTEFAVRPGKLHMGAGLHFWNGVSRHASHSTLNFMAIDANITNWYNIEATDQFARQLGVYARGQLGRWDYRVFVNKPFAFGSLRKDIISPLATNVLNENWATGGYISYMFRDKENHTMPYLVGTYLGARNILNIGAGWYHHKGATASKASPAAPVRDHAQRNFGIDLFWDQPLNKQKGTALSLYSVFYDYEYGPGYLRNIGILNLHGATQPVSAAPDASWAGGGNLQPTLGTGNIWYTQFGYLLPRLKNGMAFMPYATFTYKNFERIGKASGQFDLGLNYLINGHNAKITLNYGTRPVYRSVGGDPVRNGSKAEWILQTQIFL